MTGACGGGKSKAPLNIAAPSPPVCGSQAAPPAGYEHVVVIMEENRTWDSVGGVGFGDMPYLRSLAQQCSFYPEWTETNPSQSSLTQYIGLTSGVDNRATVDDCSPSRTCRSTDDNIFRQVRTTGGTTRTFVEGATTGCSAAGNAVRHVPAMYFYGANDHDMCQEEVRPLAELDVNDLPTFAMIVPDLCHDGHDCDNSAVDDWLRDHLGDLLAGESYRSGTTAVFVVYDEDTPVPNLIIAPTATRGPRIEHRSGHASALRTIEELLGLPVLAGAREAPSLRTSAHI